MQPGIVSDDHDARGAGRDLAQPRHELAAGGQVERVLDEDLRRPGEGGSDDIEGLAGAQRGRAQHERGGEPVLGGPRRHCLRGAAAALLERSLAIGAVALRGGLGMAQQVELAHGPVPFPLAGRHDIAISSL